MDEKDRLMMRPFTVTLNDVQWNIVLLALSSLHEQIGEHCAHGDTVYKHIAKQLNEQGKEFAKA
jgi:flavodoxin